MAVFTDKIVVQRLTDFVWAGISSALNEENCMQVSRVIYALKINLKKPGNYYKDLEFLSAACNWPSSTHPRFFPSILAYSDLEGNIIDFRYKIPLENDASCVTFLAETLEDLQE